MRLFWSADCAGKAFQLASNKAHSSTFGAGFGSRRLSAFREKNMIAEIGAGLGALKTAMDLAKGLQAASSQATVNEVKIGLQHSILEAQTALAAAQQADAATAGRIRDLEQQIMEFKDWSREAERYQLQAIDRGCFAYMPKAGMENGEPAHWLCANCFNKRQKSFLQFKGQDVARNGGRGDTSTYACDTCKGSVKVRYTRKPSEPYSGPA